jgi:hypothetical protein
MTKLATLTSLTLLLTAELVSAQTAMTSSSPSAVLTSDQCNEVWTKAVTKSETPAQADTSPDVVNFALVDTDFAQVDNNNDGTVDKEEFAAACGKGLVREPPRVNE